MKLVDRHIYDPLRDGVTQSVVKLWRECHTKAALYLNGYHSMSVQSFALIYGSMFHHLREYYIVNNNRQPEPGELYNIEPGVRDFCRAWGMPITPIVNQCWAYLIVQFNWYIHHSKTLNASEYQVLHTEAAFKEYLPMSLIPSLGKIDGVLHRMDNTKNRYLYELKTKARYNLSKIQTHLKLDLQTNLYANVAEKKWGEEITHVYYEIVRSPDTKKYKETKPEDLQKFQRDLYLEPDKHLTPIVRPIHRVNLKYMEEQIVNELGEFYRWWMNGVTLEKVKRCDNACFSQYGQCPNFDYCTSFGTISGGFETTDKLFAEVTTV